MKRKNIVFKALTCGLATLAFTACTDTWESHYQSKPELNATETLWDRIQADEELDDFEALVKATGYDVILSQSRFYTVWAPADGSDFYGSDLYNQYTQASGSIKDSLLNVIKFEFIENHIADYNHSAVSTVSENNLVKMLNGKYNSFVSVGGRYTFKNIPVSETNIAAKNGFLHKTENNVAFTANLWEQLAKEDSLSLLNGFFRLYDEIIFDEVNSVQGPMVDGQVTYLDSVVVEYNEWFGRIGQLNREDSSYTMFAPTNKAWREIYDEAKEYFIYSNKTDDRENLQDELTKTWMCHHLVFSNTINRDKRYLSDFNPETDSLTSICRAEFGTSWEKFKKDDLTRLFDNIVETKELSNGTMHIVNSYNYLPFWHDTIRLQGENLYGEAEGITDEKLWEYKTAIKSYATISKDSVDKYYQTSNGRIGIYEPSLSNNNPVLTFFIKDNLSAKYRINVVIVPKHFVNWKDTIDVLPNRVTATLYYNDIEGKKKNVKLLNKHVVDHTKVDTLTMEPFDFPTTEFNLEEALRANNTYLELKGDIGPREKGFDRTLRIEQVFLEPVTEE